MCRLFIRVLSSEFISLEQNDHRSVKRKSFFGKILLRIAQPLIGEQANCENFERMFLQISKGLQNSQNIVSCTIDPLYATPCASACVHVHVHDILSLKLVILYCNVQLTSCTVG